MTNVENELKKVVEVESKKLENDLDFQRLISFYLEMKRSGLVSHHRYNVSPLDTVGKRFYQSIEKSREKG